MTDGDRCGRSAAQQRPWSSRVERHQLATSNIRRARADGVRADGCVWDAGYKDAAGRRTISIGLKGIDYYDLRVRGAAIDVHTSMGTIVPNPAWRLVWALATLKNDNDEITIDGFMDHVRRPTADELAMLEHVPYDEDELRKIHGIRSFVRGLSGLPLKVKHFYEPTCTICGLTSGYAGEGSKTVLPAVASAKLDFRLVPDLTQDAVAELLRAHLDRRGFGDVEVAPAHGEAFAGRHRAGRARRGHLPRGVQRKQSSARSWPGRGRYARSATASTHPPSASARGRNLRGHANGALSVDDYLDHIRAFGRFLRLWRSRSTTGRWRL